MAYWNAKRSGYALMGVKPALPSATRLQRSIALGISRLALAAYGKDENRVDCINMAIQGDIAMRATTDDQFALAIAGRTANPWVVLKHIKRGDDFTYALFRPFGLMASQVIKNALKVPGDLRSQFDTRHA